MKWFHVHRYVWGKPYKQTWTCTRIHKITLQTFENEYTRTFQEGTCSCGSAKVREL